jgi:membrane-associated phospholipid phosphatase
LARPFQRSDDLTNWGLKIYHSFVWQPALVTISLSVAGMQGRAWKFANAATISLCLASFIGPLFPADTAVVYYHIPDWPSLKSAWKASEVIHAIRDGHRLIDRSMIAGLLTFPSYHACCAILFSWALYPLKILRWPVLVLNTAMFYLTVVIGGHYVVDLFGGALLAFVSIRIVQFLSKEPPAPMRAEPY